MLNTNPGIYNLLDFSNGTDTLIATADIHMERVQQIRLILGQNNSVVVDSVSYPLQIPSGSESGLKIQLHKDLQPGVAYAVLLDFDAHQSIVMQGNGSYLLKPVIRAVEDALTGSIQGSLSQPNVSAVITAVSGNGSYSSIANTTGQFIVKGIPVGTYSVTIVPAAPHNSVTLNNVNVTTGSATAVGVINI